MTNTRSFSGKLPLKLKSKDQKTMRGQSVEPMSSHLKALLTLKTQMSHKKSQSRQSGLLLVKLGHTFKECRSINSLHKLNHGSFRPEKGVLWLKIWLYKSLSRRLECQNCNDFNCLSRKARRSSGKTCKRVHCSKRSGFLSYQARN